MSKIISEEITCPQCHHRFTVQLYTTIWGENSKNRELVLNDRINVETCPSCHMDIRIRMPFLYTNAIKQFAVWWDPFHDSDIDAMSTGFAAISGKNGYLASAPRINDWEVFKRTIIQFESGEIHLSKSSKDPEQQKADLLKEIRKLNNENNEK